uniref:Reverse transcriptase domain-containing protein n=1 Tax=Tanacetum cinerariifolium TaxID=118510 RepID=A0A699IP72_TANCI|nr:hypothetical protein [Tanacetum cinerariifolium]
MTSWNIDRMATSPEPPANGKLSFAHSPFPHPILSIFPVIKAPIISISSNSSDESVGSVMSRVILFGTILIEILVVPIDLPVAPDVTTAVVASPVGALVPESHLSSKTGRSKSPLPLVPVAPMVSPYLCSDISESEPAVVFPKRHVSFSAHDAMVEIPTVSPLPAPFAFVTPATDIISPIEAPPGFSRRSAFLIRPGQAIPFRQPYRTHPNVPRQVLTVMKRVGPLPSHRLTLRYIPDHSSSNDFTLDSLPDSPLDSSLDSPSNHSLLDHLLSDHSPKNSIEEDIDVRVPADVKAETGVGTSTETNEGIGLDVEPFREDFIDLVRVNESLETGQRQLEVDSVIASAERASLSSRVVFLERSNTRLRETLRIESVRADRLQRHLSFVENELRLIRSMTPVTTEEIITQCVTKALAAQEANRVARLEAKTQSQNEEEGNNNNGNRNEGRNGNNSNGNPNGGAGRDALVARVCTYKDFLNCQPRNFSGTKGVIGLARWFKKMELELTLLSPRMVPEEDNKIKRYIWGLIDNVQGTVTSSKSVRLQDAIMMASSLMDQKVRTYAARSSNNKRKLDNDSRDNRTQPPPFKRQNVGGPEYGQSLHNWEQ